MNRLEFMKELARLLDDLPREEKIEVLKYYNGYFDEAGPEQEAAVIEELGTPEEIAKTIKAGMEEDYVYNDEPAPEQTGQKNGWKKFILILVAVVFIWLWIGLIGGIFGLAGGLLGGVFGLFGATIGGIFGNFGGGIGSIITGITMLLYSPLNGLMKIAVGIFRLGLSIFILVIAVKVVTAVSSGLRNFIHQMKKRFHGRWTG